MTSILYPTTNLSRIEQLNIVRGEGVYLYDDQGRQYLEGMAGLWCSSLGYGNAELIDAITRQLHTLSYSHMFGGRTHQVGMDLAARLGAMVPIDDARIFFANSGSEANDSLIKILHYYFNVTGQPQKKKIIALERSYHGVTLASAALTGLPSSHAHFDIPLAALGILRAESPHYYRGRQPGESEAEFTARLLRNLEQLILKEGPETIAAYIAEPVSGASGVVVPPEGYFSEVQQLLQKYDILFWADEVICGFGRTGNDFGSTTMGITPRLMTLAKQLSAAYIPISAAIIPGPLYEAMVEPSAQAGVFGHGFTYSGHPVACAAALKTLEIYERDRLFDHAAAMGRLLHQRLQGFQDHPLVGEIRGKGLIAAVELVSDKAAGTAFKDGRVGAFAQKACLENGLSLRAVAGNSMAFCPPLIITPSEIDEMIGKFTRALDRTLDYVSKENLLAS
ncbi:MAG: hypothetical protein RLZZ385_1300 [Pseudomonadota bacterium]|jgi:adenosylmethionine-8-amino-7-oxononanoate aminotransferase